MQLREEFFNRYPNVAIEVDNDMPLKQGGIYERDEIDPEGYITISGKANYYLQNGYLAEEYGHHETSYGDITTAYNKSTKDHVKALKQELQARRKGYRLAVPIEKLINCYKQGIWGDLYEMCLFMQIDRSYFKKVIEDYQKQFGSYIEYDGYLIHFKPLTIKKINKG